MASYWFKIAKFSYPLSFRALDGGDPYGIFGKALQILKLPNGHTTLLRRRYNVDTTSRRDIDVVSTSKQRSVPIG